MARFSTKGINQAVAGGADPGGRWITIHGRRVFIKTSDKRTVHQIAHDETPHHEPFPSILQSVEDERRRALNAKHP